MSEELVPVEIRSHLIPFFFHEMEGTFASYNGEKVNMIKLKCSSSLANYLYTQIDYNRADHKYPYDSFLLYLSVQTNQFYVMSGKVYIDKKGIKSELLMPLSKVREFNGLLEDVYRTNLVSYVDGFKDAGSQVSKGVDSFMVKYNLYEYGFEYQSLRKIYYEQKKTSLLNRFQNRASNKVLGFF